MKKIQKILFISAFLLFVFLFSNNVYAGSQKWNSLDYNVTLNVDGSADIVETWDVDISETNTLFKSFELSINPYYMHNVEVAQIVDGIEIPLTQIYEEQYHVDSGCYYGLMTDNHTFEIAWNVGLDDSSDTRIYKISYTVDNAVKVYNDCAEFYWQFLSDENTMTGKNVTGTITLPSGITDIEKLHIWGHGDFSGNTSRISTNTVSFDMNRIHENSMLEIRVVTEDNIFETASNIEFDEKLSDILAEEAMWAEEANAKRVMYKSIITVIAIVVLIIFIIYLKKIFKYIAAGKELKMQEYPKNELKYFRDIPDEKNATPARAGYFYYFVHTSSVLESHSSRIFSATLLELTLKKYISLEPIDKNNVKINILKTSASEPLPRDEELIYNFLVKNADNDTNSVNTKTLEKYAKKNYDAFYKLMKDVCKAAENYEEMNGVIDYDRKKISDKWSSKGASYILALIVGMFFAPILVFLLPVAIEFLVCAIICFKNSGKINALSPKAYEQFNQWNGLKNYMSDFSLLKEKEVPDLILWEKYLVYATVFGISKKVLDQLVEVYPQMTSEDYYRTGQFTYLYVASNSNFGGLGSLEKSFDNICATARSAYSSAHSSSSGSGGGFSGGGGGRRWRRKLWRKIIKIIICGLNSILNL